jgi:hypothetical protein
MFDVGVILGFMIVIVLGVILLRYLCSFGYGLFCYNPLKPSDRTINPVHIVDIVDIADIADIADISNTPDNKIIRVTVTDDCVSTDTIVREQRTIPIATMV